MTGEIDAFLAENIHRQLDLRAAYRDLGERTTKWLLGVAKELRGDSTLIGKPESAEYKGRTALTYWVDCVVKDSREFGWLAIGVQFDSEDEYQGQSGAYACAWLTPRQSLRDRFEQIQDIAKPEIVGTRPRQDGTLWTEDGSIGMKLVSRNGKPWPPLPELEKDLRTLYAEAVRVIDKLAKKKG